MNGAESLVRTAAAGGVEICFTNPGTTEMPLVAALDSVPGVRGVLALFEGVVTGAADGYGRMARKPAMTLLHLGPGFANGIANLHNARRARSPIVNLIGDHATWQRNFDPPLTSDIESLARPVSAWTRSCATSGQLSRDVATAIASAHRHPGQIATLIVPSDCQWNEAGEAISKVAPAPAPAVHPERIEAASRALTSGDTTLILLGADATGESGQRAAARIAAATQCRTAVETFPARLERGPHLPSLDRLPYFPEQAMSFLEGVQRVVLAGALDPVAFFAYPEGASRLLSDEVSVTTLADPRENASQALEALADAVDASAFEHAGEKATLPKPKGQLDPANVGMLLAAHQPEGAIVIDEGITAAGAYFPLSAQAPEHTLLCLTGGAIGMGMPSAIGAALACPDRKVMVLEGDGSGLYTVQALWTQARESLDIVNVVFANNAYRILQVELGRSGITEPGPQSTALTRLEPGVSWVGLSKSFGVPAESVETAEALSSALDRGLAEDGPYLIEVRVP